MRRITAKQRRVSKLEQPENAKVIARSGGQCEVQILVTALAMRPIRCRRRGLEVHHLIGGWRTRGRNESALSIHKIFVCRSCHRDLTEHKLQRLGGPVPLWTDCYERVR